jgi:hypothetical protein
MGPAKFRLPTFSPSLGWASAGPASKTRVKARQTPKISALLFRFMAFLPFFNKIGLLHDKPRRSKGQKKSNRPRKKGGLKVTALEG